MFVLVPAGDTLKLQNEASWLLQSNKAICCMESDS